MTAEHVLVVSLRKSGTHLLKEVMAGLGYALNGAVSSAGAAPRPLGRQTALRVLGAVYTPDEIAALKRSRDRAAVDRAVSRAVTVLNRAWHTSGSSSDHRAVCVEGAAHPTAVRVRGFEDPGGPSFFFASAAWSVTAAPAAA